MRLAVVSPFLDRRHGTERCIVEQIEYFLGRGDCEVHIYSQSVDDLEVVRSPRPFSTERSLLKPVWHRIPRVPGPHLVNFLWWYFANQSLRWFHRKFRSLNFDLVFTPGINCADADAIVAHIVFHEFHRLVQGELLLRNAPLRSWAALLHRRLYYRLIMAFETRIYRNPRIALAAVSSLAAREITNHFGRRDVTVILNAVDLARFNLAERVRRRAAARASFKFSDSDFVILLIGNDWKKKGLTYLLQALAANPELPFLALIVGRDDRTPFLVEIQRLRLDERVQFAEPSPDVFQFYAAADVYAGPSLEDSFALPPLEAMACGLPVITSVLAGVAEIITEGHDGFLLQNPKDSMALATVLRRLYENPALRQSVGANASSTVQPLTWERNGSETWEFLQKALLRKAST